MNKDQGEIELLKYRLLCWGQKYKVISYSKTFIILPSKSESAALDK